MSTDAAKAPPVDFDDFRSRTFADTALEAELLAMFLGRAPELAKVMVPTADADAIRRAAHTLSGSARGIGARRLAELAALVETSVTGPEKPSPAELARTLAAVTEEVDRVCRFAADYLEARRGQGAR